MPQGRASDVVSPDDHVEGCSGRLPQRTVDTGSTWQTDMASHCRKREKPATSG
jgi:hypothetical protein